MRFLAMAVPAFVLVLTGLACTSFGDGQMDVAPYQLGQIPPFAVCASATPLPTATPEPRPTDWLTGTWEPPNWPPTPYPTPTPHLTFGQFYRHQRIWIPVRPLTHPTASPGEMPYSADTAKVAALMLERYSDLGASPFNAGDDCLSFEFEAHNFSLSPVDLDLPAQVFLRFQGDLRLYHSDAQTYRSFDIDYPQSRFESGEIRRVTVPICKPAGGSKAVLGVLASLYETRSGSAGMTDNAVTGSDTAIYINFEELTPGCSYLPPQVYPEISDPPPEPALIHVPFSNGAVVGRMSGDLPVTIPPCLRITRGFGCSEFPTGVSGAGRCPSGMPYWHTGIDFSCSEGTPVRSPLGGVIDHWGCSGGNCGSGYGLLARVQLEGFQMYFAHLSSLGSSPLCSGQGGICEAGEVIGYVGNTGFSTGPHLHWELRVDGLPVDPMLYFGGSADAASSGGVLAAPAPRPIRRLLTTPGVAPTPVPYPLTVYLRRPDGTMLSGPTLYLTDIDGQPVGSCAFESGRCEFMLPSGVYSLRLDGDLPDGTPVDAHGRANVAAMQSDGVEYLHGPLAVWHENPGAVAGLVLVTDESGVAQPLLDAAPTGTPAPLDPLDRLLEPKAEPTSVGIQVSRPPTVVTPREAPGGGNTRWLGLLLWLLAFGVLIGGYALGMCLRRRRRRREPHAAE